MNVTDVQIESVRRAREKIWKWYLKTTDECMKEMYEDLADSLEQAVGLLIMIRHYEEKYGEL